MTNQRINPMTESLHPLNYEMRNDRAQTMIGYAAAVQWFAVGPFVFGREIHADGMTGPRRLLAITVDPTRYIRVTAGKLDIGSKLEGFDLESRFDPHWRCGMKGYCNYIPACDGSDKRRAR